MPKIKHHSKTYVKNPEKDTTFVLDSPDSLGGETSFTIDLAVDLDFSDVVFDSASLQLKYKLSGSGEYTQIVVECPGFFAMPKNAFPPELYFSDKIPPIIFKEDIYPESGEFIRIKNLKIALGSFGYSIEFESQVWNPTIQVINQRLETKYQNESALIKVTKFPIFQQQNPPMLSKVETLFKQFVTYNKYNLQFQKNTVAPAYCHIMAHFVCELLRLHGIHAQKVFKKWDDPLTVWHDFNAHHDTWSFHCAAAIVDTEDNVWVWDPWQASKKSLMSIEEWANRPDEPMPNQVLITSPAIHRDSKEGRAVMANDWYELFDTKYFNVMQGMYSSAIPNPPERPLAMAMPHQESPKSRTIQSIGFFERKSPERIEGSGTDFEMRF